MKEKDTVTREPFSGCKWIWANGIDEGKSAVVLFRKAFAIEKLPKGPILAYVAAESKYLLSVNGRRVVCDGGMNVGKFGRGCYNAVDISEYLVKGNNAISAQVFYYGSENAVLPSAGFLFDCPLLDIRSDSTFTAYFDDAYALSAGGEDCIGYGVNVRYDAQRERSIFGYEKAEFSSQLFEPSKEICEYSAAPFFEPMLDPVPVLKHRPVEKAKKIQRTVGAPTSDRYADVYTVILPRAMSVYPRLCVSATSGDVIQVRTDRYEIRGKDKAVSSVKAEYVCKAETQTFEFPQLMYGEKLIFSVPQGVKVSSLGYREVFYGGETSGYFSSGDGLLTRLYEKSANTVEYCALRSFLITPERGAALDAATASVALDAANWVFKDGGIYLAEKYLFDMLYECENDVLFGGIYGKKTESVSGTLLMLSEFGLLARYRDCGGKEELIDAFSLAALKYLMKWEVGDGGAIRKGYVPESDTALNADDELITDMLYLSAMKNVRALRERCGDHSQTEALSDGIDRLTAFIRSQFDGTGYTTVKGRYDERANAFAVLCGAADEQQYPNIAEILENAANASPLYEGYVLRALCEIGRVDGALARMKSRYYMLAQNECSTLCDGFSYAGARCALFSAAPIVILMRYVAGINFTENEATVTPYLLQGGKTEFGSSVPGGTISGSVTLKGDKAEIVIDNAQSKPLSLVLKSENFGRDIEGANSKTVTLGKGRNKIVI